MQRICFGHRPGLKIPVGKLVLMATGVMFLLTNQSALAVRTIQEQVAFTNSLIKGKSQKDGNAFIDKMYRTVTGLNDYEYNSSLTTFKHKKGKTATGRFYWKKKDRMRLDAISGNGYKDGSVVVRTAGGKIRGSGGGTLKFMKMTLEPDSRLLVLPNGYIATKSDFASLIRGIQRKLDDGHVSKVTTSAIPDNRDKKSIFVVDVLKDGKENDTIVDRIMVNASSNIPVEWDVYRNGRLFSVTLFQNFKANIKMPDKLFEL